MPSIGSVQKIPPRRQAGQAYYRQNNYKQMATQTTSTNIQSNDRPKYYSWKQCGHDYISSSTIHAIYIASAQLLMKRSRHNTGEKEVFPVCKPSTSSEEQQRYRG